MNIKQLMEKAKQIKKMREIMALKEQLLDQDMSIQEKGDFVMKMKFKLNFNF